MVMLYAHVKLNILTNNHECNYSACNISTWPVWTDCRISCSLRFNEAPLAIILNCPNHMTNQPIPQSGEVYCCEWQKQQCTLTITAAGKCGQCGYQYSISAGVGISKIQSGEVEKWKKHFVRMADDMALPDYDRDLIKAFIRSTLEAQAKAFVEGLPRKIIKPKVVNLNISNERLEESRELNIEISGFNSCRSQTLDAWRKAGLLSGG